MKNICLLIVVIIICFCSCSRTNNGYSIKIEEKAGLNRDLEYVEVTLPYMKLPQKGEAFYAYSKEEKHKIPVQIHYNNIKDTLSKRKASLVFPISIKANQTKEYSIKKEKNTHHIEETDLHIAGENMNLTVENRHFLASLKQFSGYQDLKLAAGHLGSLTLKQFNNVELSRKNPNLKMHWAPNFGKEDKTYRTMAHLTTPDTVSISTKGPYYFNLFKSGKVAGYEKITLKSEYKFYAGLPYFKSSSEMFFTQIDTLNLLRNDEMTMDSLFTHVVFPKSKGKVVSLPLYKESTLSYLDKYPIPDNAPWLFFYNEDKLYGFGSIRLYYNNYHYPTFNPHTKITASMNSGRYWNRRLISDKNTVVPKGSKYVEENAYLVFKVDKKVLSKHITYYYERLKNPVKVSVLTN